jgi:hypothetical protein
VSGRARYERWIGGYFQHEVPPTRPFLTPWRATIAGASLATWVLLLVLEPLPGVFRLPAGVALLVASIAGLLLWLRTWSVAIERAHLRLLARPDLSDSRRVALFFAALVGYGVGSLIVAGSALWLLAR